MKGNKGENGGSMSNLNAIDIANWYVSRANREREEDFGEGISNLKLQKILYFAQAAYLALEGEPLFQEEILAWDYGPVVESVYHGFKKYEKTPIPKPSTSNYLSVSSDVAEFLNDVWDLFGKYSAGKLVQMTHSHDPWKNAYDGTRNKVISKDVIGAYYKNVFSRT